MDIDINAINEKYTTAKESGVLNVSRAKTGLRDNPLRNELKKYIKAYQDGQKDFVVFDVVAIMKTLNHNSDISHMRDKYLRAIESIIVEVNSPEDFAKMTSLYRSENTEILRKYCPNRQGMGIDFNAKENLLFVTLPMSKFLVVESNE